MAMTVVHVYHDNPRAVVDAIRVVLDADYIDDLIRDRKEREASESTATTAEITKPAVSRRNSRKSKAVVSGPTVSAASTGSAGSAVLTHA